MDINFHYYAIKTIARFAGFVEDEADIIARYSQFVDDYYVDYEDDNNSIQFTVNNDVLSNCLFNSGFTLNNKGFYPVQTGFSMKQAISWTLDDLHNYDANADAVKNFLRVMVPFHFNPLEKITVPFYNMHKNNRREFFKTRPINVNNYNNLIAGGINLLNLMRQAAIEYQTANDTRQALIFIGALLHVYADTFAHEGFSGLWGWENFRKDARYASLNDGYIDLHYSNIYIGKSEHILFGVGHTELVHEPDITYHVYKCRKSVSRTQYGDYETRNNLDIFLNASLQILNYLYIVKGKAALLKLPFFLKNILIKGFLFEYVKAVKELNDKWKKFFDETLTRVSFTAWGLSNEPIVYNYSDKIKNDMHKNIQPDRQDPKYQNFENLVYFNIAAKRILDASLYYGNYNQNNPNAQNNQRDSLNLGFHYNPIF